MERLYFVIEDKIEDLLDATKETWYNSITRQKDPVQLRPSKL